MKLLSKGFKKDGEAFKRDGRISFSLNFEKSFFGLGFGSERFYGCSNDIKEEYRVFSFRIYFGPFIFNGSICGKSKPFKSNDDLYQNNMN